MRKIALLSAVVSAMLVAMLPGSPAQALNLRSWVSGTGSGTTCTRAAPCAYFQTAHDATQDGGEINCVDGGYYSSGALTISKSITIDCGGALGGFTISSIVVNTANAVVRLRNLSIDGAGVGAVGISFTNGAALYVENCTISSYVGGAGRGIIFAPPDGVTAKLDVTDSFIVNNGAAAGGGGIGISPTGAGSARVAITRSHVEGNTYGVYALGFSSTGTTIVHIKDSVVANNVNDGIGAYSGGQSTISITVDHGSSVLNGANGIAASGASTYVVLANSTVMSNATGLSSAGGGTILSYQNNQLTGNMTDGAPTGMLSVK